METLDEAKSELLGRIEELKVICRSGNAWVFVCAASFLDYLSRMVNGQNKGGSGYKDFIKIWMAQVNRDYSDFIYINGRNDLPIQMYHVLRCGLVHALSLIPDEMASDKGGRDRSIVLCHKEESIEKGKAHLSSYSLGVISDAALFVAEDFINDIETVTNIIFQKASTDIDLKENILGWLERHPVITGGF